MGVSGASGNIVGPEQLSGNKESPDTQFGHFMEDVTPKQDTCDGDGDDDMGINEMNFMQTLLSGTSTEVSIHIDEPPSEFLPRNPTRKRHSTSNKVKVEAHDGTEKRYACDICEFRSNYSYNVKAHMRSHTGEKPFACNVCDYRSAHSSDLKAHIRIHTGEKPFVCGKCDYKCAQSKSLKRHMIKHRRLAQWL